MIYLLKCQPPGPKVFSSSISATDTSGTNHGAMIIASHNGSRQHGTRHTAHGRGIPCIRRRLETLHMMLTTLPNTKGTLAANANPSLPTHSRTCKDYGASTCFDKAQHHSAVLRQTRPKAPGMHSVTIHSLAPPTNRPTSLRNILSRRRCITVHHISLHCSGSSHGGMRLQGKMPAHGAGWRRDEAKQPCHRAQAPFPVGKRGKPSEPPTYRADADIPHWGLSANAWQSHGGR